jgi:preprotein translocase subunit SecG
MHFNRLTIITILFAFMFCVNAIPSTLKDSELNKVVGQQTEAEKKAAAAAAEAEAKARAKAQEQANIDRVRREAIAKAQSRGGSSSHH